MNEKKVRFIMSKQSQFIWSDWLKAFTPNFDIKRIECKTNCQRLKIFFASWLWQHSSRRIQIASQPLLAFNYWCVHIFSLFYPCLLTVWIDDAERRKSSLIYDLKHHMSLHHTSVVYQLRFFPLKCNRNIHEKCKKQATNIWIEMCYVSTILETLQLNEW